VINKNQHIKSNLFWRAGFNIDQLLMRRIIAVVAEIGPIFFIVVSFITQLLQPNYNPFRQPISTLVHGSFGWLQTLDFALFGLFLGVFAAGLNFNMERRRGFRTVIFILMLTGFGFILVAIFPNNVMESGPTIHGFIHGFVSRGIALLFVLANFLLAPIMRRDARWKSLATYTLITGIIAFCLVLLPLELWAGKTETYAGLRERLLVINDLVWIEIMAIRLFAISFHEQTKSD
jgi:hypothetical membrane protein